MRVFYIESVLSAIEKASATGRPCDICYTYDNDDKFSMTPQAFETAVTIDPTQIVFKDADGNYHCADTSDDIIRFIEEKYKATAITMEDTK